MIHRQRMYVEQTLRRRVSLVRTSRAGSRSRRRGRRARVRGQGYQLDDAVAEEFHPPDEARASGKEGGREGEERGKLCRVLAEEGAEAVEELEDFGGLGALGGVEGREEEAGDDYSVDVGRWGG